MRSTLAVVIGVSKYQSGIFPALPGATADARAVSQALISWGVSPKNIKLLLDDVATRSRILHALRVWPFEVAEGREVRLIVFFAGHGTRVKETGRPDCSVLIAHDTDPSDRKATGVGLADLMGALTRVRPVESYLFLDACSLRIDMLENILPDSEVLGASGSSCMFCLVASGLDNSFEDIGSSSGYFTRSVLRRLSELRHQQNDCMELVRRVQSDLKASNLPLAEYYLIGKQECFPLPDASEARIQDSGTEQELVSRLVPLSKLRDVIVQNPGRTIWMWGESGRGKTVLIRQLCQRTIDSIYCSVPRPNTSLAEFWVHVATEIADQLPVLFPSGRPLTGEARNTFSYLSRKMPGCMIIIDHGERLQSHDIIALLAELGKALTSIIISRHRAEPRFDVIGWECPRLDHHEVEAFRERYGPTVEMSSALLEAASNRNPLELRTLLSEGNSSPRDLLRSKTSPSVESAVSAIVGTNGFVDERIFRECFDVQTADLSRLSEMGLVIFQQGRYLPHDSLIELALQLQLQANPNLVITYWERQLESTPRNLWACLQLVEIVVKSGYQKQLDPTLELALESLVRVRDWRMVEVLGAKIANDCDSPSSAALYAAEQLVRLAKYSAVDLVVQRMSDFELTTDLLARVRLIQAERAWWFGDFEKAAQLSERVIGESTDNNVLSRASVNLGIALFFRGEWKEATDTLSVVIRQDWLEPRVRGWSSLILGTIYGLRGVDIEEGRSLLMSSIRVLDQIGDDAGLAVAWGNLGEMTWKCGDYRASLVQLTTGYSVAEAIDGPALKIEIARNLVHLQLRMKGPWSEELESALNLSNQLVQGDMGRTVGMQLWNTFGTVAAYRRDVEQLKHFISCAETHTKGNAEYHIYTLANEALQHALESESKVGERKLTEAFELALQGTNLLAIEQIRGDVHYIHECYPTPATAHLWSIAKEWQTERK